MPTLRSSCASASRASRRDSGSTSSRAAPAFARQRQAQVAAVERAAREQPAQFLEGAHRLDSLAFEAGASTRSPPRRPGSARDGAGTGCQHGLRPSRPSS
jgi:hypothetical protein